jgi:hypothetical protein
VVRANKTAKRIAAGVEGHNDHSVRDESASAKKGW